MTPPPERSVLTKRTILPLLIVLLLFALATLRARESDTAGEIVRTRLLMGPVVEIAATGPRNNVLEEAVSAAFDEMARIDRLMGPQGEDSDISRLSAATSALEVSAETAEVIALGLDVSQASEGAFHLAMGRLKNLWGIDMDAPRVPAPEKIAQARPPRNALRLEGRQVIKSRGDLKVDLGGIAKGYAVDRAAEILARAGVTSATINAGGDMRLVGARPERPWRIGVQHPRRPGEVYAILTLPASAVVTSGDYERFFEEGGRRYHHLLDPATGYPAQGIQAVTVVAEEAALADALSTAVFILGVEKGLALLHRWPKVEGLIIDGEGAAHVTPALEERIEWR